MTFEAVLKIYNKKKKKFPDEAYKHVSEIFQAIKENYTKDATSRGIVDTEQSWKSFKGHNLEKLIQVIIEDEISSLGLSVISGNKLERRLTSDETISYVKRNLLIDFGEFGLHLPDADIVIYNPKNFKVLAIISVKVTLRERIAQTGYWKLKLNSQKITKHIKVFFATLDEDEVLSEKKPCKKSRAVCEIDTDGCYVLTTNKIAKSKIVKPFSEFINDLKKTVKNK